MFRHYGPGIDAGIQGTLFDRFNRGENRNSDGTGIGLALVRRFRDQLGWAIDCHSEMGKGTPIAGALQGVARPGERDAAALR